MQPNAANDNAPQPSAQQTRPQWFDELLVKYEPLMRGECAKRAGVMSKEDLYQEAVLWAISKWHQYRTGPDGGFGRWIVFIIRTALREHRKKNRLETTTLTDAHTKHSPPAQEHYVDIEMTLRNLSDTESNALSLVAAGYSYQDIGESYGVSRQAVFDSVTSGRRKVRAINDNKKLRKRCSNRKAA